MAKIPTPTQRGQAVGSVQSQFTPTPFQNLNPDADVFGAGQARALGQVAKGLGALSSDVMKEVESDDKLELTKFETEVKSRQLTENARIGSLVGQEQQDAAAAAPTDFKAFVEGARARYKFQLPDNTVAADNFSALSESQFSANAVAAFTSGKAVVDKQVSASRLVTAGRNLVANPTQVGAFESVVNSAVLDPDIGSAQAGGLDPSLITYSGTDPKKLQQKNLLENMVAEQQALGLRQVVDSLVAKGDFAGATTFLDGNPQLGANTAGRTAAEAQVATFRQKVQGQQEFAVLLRDLSAEGKPASLADLRSKIAAVPDVNMRARLLSEYSIHAASQTAAVNETLRAQGSAVVSGLIKGTPAADIVRDNSQFFARHPDALLRLTTGAQTRAVEAARAISDEDAAFIGSGGGGSNVPGLSNVMSRMFQSDSAEAAKLIDGGQLKKYFDRTTYEGLQQQAGAVKELASKRETKNPTNAGTIMRRYLGYSTAEVEAVMRVAGPRLTDAVHSVEKAAIAAGRPVDAEDVRKVVFENLVKIRTLDRYLVDLRGDKYTVLSAVTQAQVDDGFNPYDALMGEGAVNDRTLAFLFGKGVDEIVAARESLDDRDREYTMNNLAIHFGVDSPPDAREAAANEQAMDDMATDAGYPPDFVEYVIKSLRQPLDIDSATQTIKDLKGGAVRGVSTETLLQAWATR